MERRILTDYFKRTYTCDETTFPVSDFDNSQFEKPKVKPQQPNQDQEKPKPKSK